MEEFQVRNTGRNISPEEKRNKTDFCVFIES
jgi:hypothetical protein